VYHIVTPRAAGTEPAGKPLTGRWRFPRTEEEKADWGAGKLGGQILANVNAYNRDAARLRGKLLVKNSSPPVNTALPEGEICGLSAAQQTADAPAADRLRDRRQPRRPLPAAGTSRLADPVRNAYVAAYLFSVRICTVTCTGARVAYPVVAGCCFALYLLTWHRRWHSKHLGLPRPGGSSARAGVLAPGWRERHGRRPLPAHALERPALVSASRLQNSAFLAELEGAGRRPAGQPWALLNKYWVEGQRDYFDKRAIPRDRKKKRLLEVLGWGVP